VSFNRLFGFYGSKFLSLANWLLIQHVHKQELNNYNLLLLLLLLLLLTASGLIPGGSDYFTCRQNKTLVTTKFKPGGLHEKHVVALGKLGTTSAFAFRARETKKNLCRGGRS
jgi:hypothetical protein